jgi:hypothetical protein
MNTRSRLYLSVAAIALAGFLAAAPAQLSAQQGGPPGVSVGATDLGGVVTGPSGPEAGVWVIAETTDLPTKFTKIVVTDDQGRYLIPDLPKAKYKVSVRGYGLIDSAKVDGEPGKTVNLTAVKAPDEKAAAHYYPPIYWYSMLKVPAANEFPGKGTQVDGIADGMKSQPMWLNQIKTTGCMSCHALGTEGTRTISKDLGTFKNSAEAWERRIQSGQAMTQMVNVMNRLGPHSLKLWGEWTDRIADGELPFDKPSRPQGIERNLVLTLWDWSTPTAYMHDLISTDRRKPTINAGGKLYGAPENSTDHFPVLDPKTHTATTVKHPVRDPNTPNHKTDAMAPSPIWGPEPIWDSQTSIHNQMMDEKGRVWAAARIRPPANPDFCKAGSDHPSAKIFPLQSANRQVSIYDPATEKFTLISTCFPTHHLIFAEDANQTLWLSSGVTGPAAAGWINRKMFEETGDEVKSQGWTVFVLDTNGNGKRDEYVEPNQPVDPAKDKRIETNLYSVAINPNDGSVWGTRLGFPGHIVRIAPGSDPTHTALTEIYEPPLPGYGPRGGDIGRDGIYWASLASGHLGKFDRSKCKVLNGPTATGKHCPEGWTLYKFPGPQFKDVKDEGSAEASYYTWVDHHNTVGLGANVPISTANLQDGFVGFKDGRMILMRVPYPMGFYAKGLDGRIDDPNAGWKGRGLWSASGDRTPWLNERGKGAYPMAVQIQVRPDPLAK